MNLNEVLKKVLLANELSGNQAAAYRFSDADGKTGRSGYSFGVCQFDLAHNGFAAAILEECGFDFREIAALKNQTCESLVPYNQRLQLAKNIVDRYDDKECQKILSTVKSICSLRTIRLLDDLALLALADYHNQFHMDVRGKLANHLAELRQPILADDVFMFKLTQTEWGKKRPDDVKRRHGNLVRIWEEITA